MGNLLGDNHFPYVQDQIKVRQEVLGKSSKTSQDIVWENGKTSWVRLASSVNIDGQEVPRYDEENNEDYIQFYFGGASFREQYLELTPESYSGNRLASELTLSGGTPLNDQHRFGITSTNSTLPGIQNSQGDGSAAYGLGGTEFGIKPMPGITGFNSKTYDNGSLRMAEVTIVAHNKKQFEYLESLYLRVGYTMLLEWGNTSYPKKIENGLTTYSSTSDIASLSLKNDFLEGSDKGVDYFYSKIEKNRELSCGNYDGFLGKVTNFSWGFDTNGSYNITLKLITIGSVIESLKINTNLASFRELENENNPDKFRPSALSTYLDIVDFYPITLAGNDLEIQSTVAEQTRGATTVVDSSFIQSTVVDSTQTIDNLPIDVEGENQDSTTQTVDFGITSVEEFEGISTILDEVTVTANQPNPKPITTSNDSTYKGSFTEGEQKALGGYGSDSQDVGCRVAFGLRTKTTKTYVRLGEFLNFINKSLLIYDGVDEEGQPRPIISIDTSEDQYCYSNGYQFPSSPEKVIIRFQNVLNLQSSKPDINVLPKLPKFHDSVNGVQVGRIMNLYYSTDYIRKVATENTDGEDGKLKLLPFITRLIETNNFLLGGINKLKVRIKEDITDLGVTQVVQFYDEVQPFGKEKLYSNQKENPILNVYGFSKNLTEGNFVTDYNFNTTIDKDFATQIAIGAQASGRSVGEDSTIFSKWNEGLVDRVLPKKLDIDQVKEEGTNARLEFKGLTTEYLNLLKSLIATSFQTQKLLEGKYDVRYDNIFTFDNVYIQSPSTTETTDQTPLFSSQFGPIQRSFFTKALSWLALTKNTPTPFIGFLPVNLSLTFDGLSGIRIFDKLRVNSDFLPSNYTDTLEFIITQLDHKFENNKWLTTVGTLSIPKMFADTDPSVVFNIGELINESFERRNESIDTESYFYSDQEIITGGGSGKVTINQILGGLNDSPEIQAKFKNLLDGIISVLGKGFEIRINSAYRDFRDSNRVYYKDYPDATQRFDKALRSPHTYGLALDISLYEPIPGQPGSSTNLIAGKGEEFVEIWTKLKITDIAKKFKLRWGGAFTQALREPGTGKVIGTKPYYDCVHFDAAPTPWPTNASEIFKNINIFYPNISLIMTYGYKTNFRDFGIGTQIYDSISLKDLLTPGNILGPSAISPSLTIIKQSGNAKNVLYKSILIDGNLTYSSGGDTINLKNLLTNSTG